MAEFRTDPKARSATLSVEGPTTPESLAIQKAQASKCSLSGLRNGIVRMVHMLQDELQMASCFSNLARVTHIPSMNIRASSSRET